MRKRTTDTPASEPIEKKTGVAHFFAAGRYSMQGFRRLVQESAFRHELLAFVAGLALFAIVGASFAEFLGFVVLMAILFSVEAINTAIEELVDRISPEISTVGRNAKDLGSFAVFCLLVANGLYAAYVVFF
ncbi:diacylglycerol kinase [Rhizobium cremeum]|uniref:diacylglycerol kinase n=1 Tax=Rhizobium cremeum TaxID=2813827 RepID=UPI000DD62A19|nr:diacylglycerol kinase [Rhizobium cremeum]MCJ7993186.1 diacylglycerol kinase [Rhizobium cremeum]MCJ7998251.1 diacylglycerol kinase [Rhizobium cremeum]